MLQIIRGTPRGPALMEWTGSQGSSSSRGSRVKGTGLMSGRASCGSCSQNVRSPSTPVTRSVQSIISPYSYICTAFIYTSSGRCPLVLCCILYLVGCCVTAAWRPYVVPMTAVPTKPLTPRQMLGSRMIVLPVARFLFSGFARECTSALVVYEFHCLQCTASCQQDMLLVAHAPG